MGASTTTQTRTGTETGRRPVTQTTISFARRGGKWLILLVRWPFMERRTHDGGRRHGKKTSQGYRTHTHIFSCVPLAGRTCDCLLLCVSVSLSLSFSLSLYVSLYLYVSLSFCLSLSLYRRVRSRIHYHYLNEALCKVHYNYGFFCCGSACAD